MNHTDVKIGIIGGSGIYNLESLKIVDTFFPDTPWGKPSCEIKIGSYENKKIAFLSRHGMGHTLLPIEVPSRANICALKMLGVEEIVAFSAVGSLRKEIEPTNFVIPSQIIDRTRFRSKESTFFGNGIVGHISFAEPFSTNLASRILKIGETLDINFHKDKTILCMEGPQFSTKAESHLYRSWGGDVINMSVLPEAKLAKEAEIAYQMVCMSTDYDCWHEEEEYVTKEMIFSNLQKNTQNAKQLIEKMIPSLGNGDDLSLVGKTKSSIFTDPSKWENSEQLEKLKVLLSNF